MVGRPPASGIGDVCCAASASSWLHCRVSLDDVSDRWADWMLHCADAWNVTLIAGNDLTYHHEAEVHFAGVIFMSLASEFNWAVFREPSASELEHYHALGVLDLDGESQVFACEAETANGRGTFLIVAESVRVNIGLVSH